MIPGKPYNSRLCFTVLLLVFVATWWLLPMSSTTLTIELEVERPGMLQVFWAGSGRGYADGRSTSFRTIRGQTRYEARIWSPTPITRLRIDPDIKPGRVRLKKVGVRRYSGTLVTLEGAALRDRLTLSSAGLVAGAEEAMLFRLDGGDPQMELTFNREQRYRSLLVDLPVFLVMSFLVVLYFRHRGSRREVEQAVTGADLRLAAVVCLAGAALTTWGIYASNPLQLCAPLAAAWTAHLACRGHHHFAALLRRPGNRYPLILSALFLVFVGYPVMHVLTSGDGTRDHGDEERSTTDEDGAGSSLADRLAQWLEHDFAYRERMVNLDATVSIELFAHSPKRRILLGKNGFFFEGVGERKVEQGVIRSFDNVMDYAGLLPFTEAELAQWGRVLTQRRDWLRRQGIDYVFVLAPTKAQIYPEFLPDSIQDVARQSERKPRYDQLIEYLAENTDVPVVDLKRALLAAKHALPEGQYLYYRTDFHWNFLGALYAYQAIVDEINRAYPRHAIRRLGLDDFVQEADSDWVHARFMGMLGLDPEAHRNETYIRMIPREGNPLSQVPAVPSGGVQDIYLPEKVLRNDKGHGLKIDQVDNPAGQLSTMMIIGDSFIEKLVLYFSAHAQKTHFQRAVFQFPFQYFDLVKPEIVVQEVLNMYILRDPPAAGIPLNEP